jgi:uncharacterized protein YbjT (DUF2867 family)
MNQWEGIVLVTGAAGTLGRRIVKNLLNKGIPVRALVRRAEQADDLRRIGAEVVIGDVTEKASLVPAVVGVTGIISAAGVVMGKGNNTPESVDFQGNATLIDLAVQANVRHFVLISVIGAQFLRVASIFPAKFHAEQYLRQSGLTWTILRGGAFMPTYHQAWERGGKVGRYDVVGNANKAIYTISPDDLAELAVRSLWEAGARATTLDVTNDEALTAPDIAAIHSRVFNRPIRLRRLPTLLLKVARLPLKRINPPAADFLGFLQAVGDNILDGRPDVVRHAFPGFEFEGYEAYLRKTEGKKPNAEKGNSL